ncbi:hypothetical protein SAMN05421741_11818 [Paenimyroides ummariense]|uniref:Uncharacterized protein n=1 Tax=Paenimyroides ummariense TaxID=913024 RepID=A0A1I5DZG4_9FLAO|nr:hypothetical protein SAMN05421741_11818 [Paenimyroides ummariense]
MGLSDKYQIWIKVPTYTISNLNSYYVTPGYVATGYVKDY